MLIFPPQYASTIHAIKPVERNIWHSCNQLWLRSSLLQGGCSTWDNIPRGIMDGLHLRMATVALLVLHAAHVINTNKQVPSVDNFLRYSSRLLPSGLKTIRHDVHALLLELIGHQMHEKCRPEVWQAVRRHAYLYYNDLFRSSSSTDKQWTDFSSNNDGTDQQQHICQWMALLGNKIGAATVRLGYIQSTGGAAAQKTLDLAKEAVCREQVSSKLFTHLMRREDKQYIVGVMYSVSTEGKSGESQAAWEKVLSYARIVLVLGKSDQVRMCNERNYNDFYGRHTAMLCHMLDLHKLHGAEQHDITSAGQVRALIIQAIRSAWDSQPETPTDSLPDSARWELVYGMLQTPRGDQIDPQCRVAIQKVVDNIKKSHVPLYVKAQLHADDIKTLSTIKLPPQLGIWLLETVEDIVMGYMRLYYRKSYDALQQATIARVQPWLQPSWCKVSSPNIGQASSDDFLPIINIPTVLASLRGPTTPYGERADADDFVVVRHFDMWQSPLLFEIGHI